MSTLTKKELESRLNNGSEDSIIVTPILDIEKQVNQIGVDCRLGNQFIIFKTQNIESIDIKKLSKEEIHSNNIQEEVVVRRVGMIADKRQVNVRIRCIVLVKNNLRWNQPLPEVWVKHRL